MVDKCVPTADTSLHALHKSFDPLPALNVPLRDFLTFYELCKLTNVTLFPLSITILLQLCMCF